MSRPRRRPTTPACWWFAAICAACSFPLIAVAGPVGKSRHSGRPGALAFVTATEDADDSKKTLHADDAKDTLHDNATACDGANDADAFDEPAAPAEAAMSDDVDRERLPPRDSIDEVSPEDLPDELPEELPDARSFPIGQHGSDLIVLRDKVRRVLKHYQGRTINARDNNCWEVMHWIIAYGVNSQIRSGGPRGAAVNSIGWLCYGNRCAGQALVNLEQGRIAAAKGPRVQGHHGQFLAILAQSKVMKSYPMRAGNRNFTVADLIETEKLGCEEGIELTFKLIALAHYLDLNETWRNRAGQEWSVSRLVRDEIKAPIRGAACGGTHRLMGLSYAVHERRKRGQPIDGQFRRAEKYINDFHAYTFAHQNADGSFSTEWFKGRGTRTDLDRRLQTTGHILEWMVYSAPAEMLRDPRLVKAVDYLSGILLAQPERAWSIGTLGHGLHALALYDERVFQSAAPPSLARRRGDHVADVREPPEIIPIVSIEARQPVVMPVVPGPGRLHLRAVDADNQAGDTARDDGQWPENEPEGLDTADIDEVQPLPAAPTSDE